MRIKVKPTGELIIPEGQLKALGAKPGDEMVVEYKGDQLVVKKHKLDDPFERLHEKGPDHNEVWDKAMRDQKEKADKAKNAFDELLKNPPKLRKEDRRDLWD